MALPERRRGGWRGALRFVPLALVGGAILYVLVPPVATSLGELWRPPPQAEIGAPQIVAAMFLSERRPRVTRWVGAHYVDLRGGTDEEARYLDELLVDVNEAIAGSGVTFTRVTPGTIATRDLASSMITIRIAPRVEWDAMLRTDLEAEFGIPKTARGYAWFDQLGPSGVAKRATLLIDPDQFVEGAEERAQERMRTIAHELAHILGIRSHNPLDKESVLYAGATGQRSTAVMFSDTDRRLLRFLYLHLQPGDGAEQIRRAFYAHWDAPDRGSTRSGVRVLPLQDRPN